MQQHVSLHLCPVGCAEAADGAHALALVPLVAELDVLAERRLAPVGALAVRTRQHASEGVGAKRDAVCKK